MTGGEGRFRGRTSKRLLWWGRAQHLVAAAREPLGWWNRVRDARSLLRIREGAGGVFMWSIVVFIMLLGGSLGHLRAEERTPWIYDSQGRCDPFVPLVRDGRIVSCGDEVAPVPPPSETGVLELGGILWDPGGVSIALINGSEATVGDWVNGHEIVEIRKAAVVVREADGTMRTLVMPSEEGVGEEESYGSGHEEANHRE